MMDFKIWADKYLYNQHMDTTSDNYRNLKTQIKERIYLLIFAQPQEWKIDKNTYHFQYLWYYVYQTLPLNNIFLELDKKDANLPIDIPNIENYPIGSPNNMSIFTYEEQLLNKLSSIYKRYKNRCEIIKEYEVQLECDPKVKVHLKKYKRLQEDDENTLIKLYNQFKGVNNNVRNTPPDLFESITDNESLLYEYLLHNINKDAIYFLSKGYWWQISTEIRTNILSLLSNLESNRWLGYVVDLKYNELVYKLLRPHLYLYIYSQEQLTKKLLALDGAYINATIFNNEYMDIIQCICNNTLKKHASNENKDCNNNHINYMQLDEHLDMTEDIEALITKTQKITKSIIISEPKTCLDIYSEMNNIPNNKQELLNQIFKLCEEMIKDSSENKSNNME